MPADAEQSIRYLTTEAGPIYDIAVPVSRGGLGQVRLGISAAPIAQAVNDLTGRILWVTLLLAAAGLLLGLPLSATIARPLRRLTSAARTVAGGRFDIQVPEGGKDEVGQLARAFNAMVGELRESRAVLVSRNRELATEVALRQAAENRLAAQLTFLETLLEQLPTPVYFKDLDGVYLGCNRAFEEFLGQSRDVVLGRTVRDLFPEAEARVHTRRDEALRAAPGTCSYEAEFRGPAGCRQAVFHKTTFNDPAGRPAGLVGVIIDVTREREVDRLRKEFVATTAHEFQTPLTAILGFCELLQEYDPGHPERSEYLGIIHERAEFLSRLVDQFLDVSRIEAGRSLPLAPVADRTEELVQRVLRSFGAGTANRIEVQMPDPCPMILADEDRLAQVMQNLLSNAVKYSAAGTCIRIGGTSEDGFFHFSVENQGAGLQPQDLERIFDKFFRADTRTRPLPGPASDSSSARRSSRRTAAASWRPAPPA